MGSGTSGLLAAYVPLGGAKNMLIVRFELGHDQFDEESKLKQSENFIMSSTRVFLRKGAWRYRFNALTLLMAFCGALVPVPVPACTPAFATPTDPIVLSGFIRPSDKFAAPNLLPANAKGAVYQSMVALNQSNFRMFKGYLSISVPIRLVRLFAMDRIDTVTAIHSIARSKIYFYRIEPLENFEIGQVYQVKSDLSANDATYVKIGPTVVDLAKIELTRTGETNRETVFSAVPCSALPARMAIVQQFAFKVPPAFAPYRSLMFAVAHNNAGTAWHSLPNQDPANPGEWNDQSRALGLQDRTAYFSIDKVTRRNVTSVLRGSVAMLEIDDAWHYTAPLSFALEPDKVPAADSLAFLTDALDGNNVLEVYRRLDVLPLRSADYRWASRSGSWYDIVGWTEDALGEWRSARRRTALVRKLGELSNSPDETIRLKAKAAMQRVRWR